MTRIQFAVVTLLLLLLLAHALGLSLLRDLTRTLAEPSEPVGVVHGIETSWRSAKGSERAWSLTGQREDYRAWLAAHVEFVEQAQLSLPQLAR